MAHQYNNPLNGYLPQHMQQPEPQGGYQMQYGGQGGGGGGGGKPKHPDAKPGIEDPCPQCGARVWWNYCYNQVNSKGERSNCYGKWMWKCKACNVFKLNSSQPYRGLIAQEMSQKGGGPTGQFQAPPQVQQQPQSSPWSHQQRGYAGMAPPPQPQQLPQPVPEPQPEPQSMAAKSLAQSIESMNRMLFKIADHTEQLEKKWAHLDWQLAGISQKMGVTENNKSSNSNAKASGSSLSDQADAELLDLVCTNAQ